ncbi:helicase-associated domain-containing protein [Arthrobacter cryoconiti]|uniref:Helicase-associated domain-containing protein n=1 Tax=Arthrobacter cryoconiti TaxID=748907 RepID=A0ABV8R4W8_9MICC|nr:helicase-associated domain-containing protein [Arthrobacter cryoconiti]MCC9066817.1 helicase-associated domain-containing protein [Arthrobacter cryoconiti]
MSTLPLLIADLAARDDTALLRLLTLRPELMDPVAVDFAALAARACSRAGLARTLDRLNRPQLQVLTALVVTANPDYGATVAEVTTAVSGATHQQVTAILAQLCDYALAVNIPSASSGTCDAGHRHFLPVTNVREMLGSHPAGLGRSYRQLGASAETTLADDLDALLADAPAGAAELLAKLVPGPPLGVLGRGNRGPADWLLDKGFLVAIDKSHVELPREMGLALRHGHVISHFEPVPAKQEIGTVPDSLRDNAALSAIATLLRTMASLLESVNRTPLPTLAAGGVGVRPVRNASQDTDTGVAQLYFYLELASMAGLLTLDPDTSTWRPTATGWLQRERAEQWLWLVTAWLESTRLPSLVGSGKPVVTVLSGAVLRPDAAMLRATVLDVLGTYYGGARVKTVPPHALAPTITELGERYAWHYPRPARRVTAALPGFLAEAEILGITGASALTDMGASVIARDWENALALVDQALPKPVEHVLLQGDLTAIAPGYLSPALSGELALIADTEGKGAAGIYRFSTASLGRGFTAGRSEADITAFLSKHSTTPIPQPLGYLIKDAAARHGRIMLGAASTFITTDTPARLAELLAGDIGALVRFTLIAPTVAISALPPAEVDKALRAIGVNASLANGDLAIRANPTRVKRPREPAEHATLAPYEAAAARARIETGGDLGVVPLDPRHEQLALLRSRPAWSPGHGESATALVQERLSHAVATGALTQLTMAGSDGGEVRLVVRPLALIEGRLRVSVPDAGHEQWIPVSRIITAEKIPEATKETP